MTNTRYVLSNTSPSIGSNRVVASPSPNATTMGDYPTLEVGVQNNSQGHELLTPPEITIAVPLAVVSPPWAEDPLRHKPTMTPPELVAPEQMRTPDLDQEYVHVSFFSMHHCFYLNISVSTELIELCSVSLQKY